MSMRCLLKARIQFRRLIMADFVAYYWCQNDVPVWTVHPAIGPSDEDSALLSCHADAAHEQLTLAELLRTLYAVTRLVSTASLRAGNLAELPDAALPEVICNHMTWH